MCLQSFNTTSVFVEGVSIIHEGKYPVIKHLGIYKGKGMSWRACPISEASTLRLWPAGLSHHPMACPNGHVFHFTLNPRGQLGRKENILYPNQVKLRKLTATCITQDLEELPKMAGQSFVSIKNCLLLPSQVNMFDTLK